MRVSLWAIARPAAREPAPLVTLARSPTMAKVDRVRRLQVHPVLGRHVVEGEQGIGPVGDLGDCFHPLGTELVGEGLDRRLGVRLVLGVADLGQLPAGGRLDRARPRVQYVRGCVEPARLLGAGGRVEGISFRFTDDTGSMPSDTVGSSRRPP